MPGYVYVIHFDRPLHHASHYIGCTADLLNRLTRHAFGRGSKIISAVLAEGGEWRLGALGTCTKVTMRRLEREVKNQHNASRYCEVCSQAANRIGGTISYPIASIPYLATSKDIRAKMVQPGLVEFGVATAADADWIAGGVITLMNDNRVELGFIPVSGGSGIIGACQRGQIIYAKMDGKIIGYVLYTSSREEMHIHQCCVKDSERGQGIGRELVHRAKVAAVDMQRKVGCAVREDLAANGFWLHIGFVLRAQVRHKTSGNILNVYSNQEGGL